MDKLISIIIPCYNVENYIDRCFASLLAQTVGFDRLEVILVDDCSADHTWDRLTAIEAAHPDSVMIVHCDENGRQGRARNIGLQYASAPYVSYVDADDWVEPDMYEKLYDRMTACDCDIVMGQLWRDSGQPGQSLPPKLTGQADRLFEIDTAEKRRTFNACASMGYIVCNKLFRRDFLLHNDIFFPEQLAYEDHFFLVLMYFYARRVYVMEERFYHYFVNPASTVLSPDASHHRDVLTVNKMIWAECEARGFLTDYRQIMEYLFLTLGYLVAMKMLSLRMTRVPYDFFLELKEETLRRVPDYRANPYVGEYVTEFDRIQLSLLELPVSEADLNSVCDAVRTKYSRGTLRIYIMTHVPFRAPQDPIYRPLHVGRALKEDLGYQGDNTGDNISALNPYYSELTGLYWVWKNVRDAEYVGLCHYRRYFLNGQNRLMTRADFLPLLERYDLIVSEHVESERCYRDVYAEAHNIHDLDAVGDAIAELYPGCLPFFREALEGKKAYCGHLFVTQKTLFDEYAAWLFSVFDRASEQIDVSSYDAYHKRVYGFLSEQLIYVWIRWRGLSWHEAHIGFTQEKAETLALKERLTALLNERNAAEAYLLLRDSLKTRPDLIQPTSDFSQELRAILLLTTDCLAAEMRGEPSPLGPDTDLNELLGRYEARIHSEKEN